MEKRIKSNWAHRFLLLTAFLGFSSLSWAIPIYKLTFVPNRVLVLFAFVATGLGLLLSLPLIWKAYRMKTRTGRLLALLWSIAVPGILGVSMLLISNYYLAGGDPYRREVPILERRSVSLSNNGVGESNPVFHISYRGQEKDLKFHPRVNRWFEDYGSVILTLKRGYWGYEIIEGKAVTK